jgi:putative tricarboxylic transport membrane protein
MEILDNLILGLGVALIAVNLFYCALGVALGVIVGVLPGLGSAATIAILLPVTYHIETTPAIIMLAGIWYGSMFGGAVTAILFGIPGQSTAVMTVMDGHALARRGDAHIALQSAVFSSFAGGIIGFLGLLLVAPPLAAFALEFGPPEFFAFTIGGLLLVAFLGTNSVTKALIAAVLGLLLGTVGLDPITADSRFTYHTLQLQSGIGLVPLIMGLFGISEVFLMLEQPLDVKGRYGKILGRIGLIPDRALLAKLAAPIMQGGVVGFFTGILPGCGAAISSYVSYAMVKRISPARSEFGRGAVEGVAAPESGNNAATCSGMIPLLTLGLPADIVPAILLGAFLLHGVTPGPAMVIENPEMFWGIVASFLVGNVMVMLFMMPLLKQIARVAEIPRAFIAPTIVLVSIAGVYGINNNPGDIWVMLGFGLLGYLLKKFDYPLAPLVLAFVLGPIMEMSLRQSLILSRGSFSIFVERPLSASILALVFLVIVGPAVVSWAKNGMSRNGE